MAFEHRPNSAMLFDNKSRKRNERDPDWRGDGMIDGVPYWISLWFSETRSGKPCLNLRFNPKDEDAARAQNGNERPAPPRGFDRAERDAAPPPPQPAPAPREPSPQRDIYDDDIPF